MLQKLKSFTFFSLPELKSLILGRIKKKNSNLTFSRVLIESLLKKKYRLKKGRDTFLVNEYNGLNIYVRKNSSDTHVFQQIFIDNEYQAVVDLINAKNIEINTIVDCGANVGYSTLFLSRFFPQAFFVDIEPDSGNMNIVKENVRVNGLKNIEFIQKGIWPTHAWLKLNKDFRDGRNWSFSLEAVSSPALADTEAISISDIINKYKINYIDLLKMDIEGAERYLFKDLDTASTFLNKTKVLAIEIHDEYDIREHIYSILNQSGFELLESGELTIAYKI